nr:hypothetical protein [Mycoplasmopsis bovis]
MLIFNSEVLKIPLSFVKNSFTLTYRSSESLCLNAFICCSLFLYSSEMLVNEYDLSNFKSSGTLLVIECLLNELLSQDAEIAIGRNEKVGTRNLS